MEQDYFDSETKKQRGNYKLYACLILFILMHILTKTGVMFKEN